MSALHQESATSGKTDDRMLERLPVLICSPKGKLSQITRLTQ
jgi:hypothetical protein